MRLTDADREQLFERLNRQAAAGAIALDELERRVTLVSEAETRPRWRRGHGDADAPDADWRPTPERFRDPRTNRVMRVWEDSGGARHYVPDDDQR